MSVCSFGFSRAPCRSTVDAIASGKKNEFSVFEEKALRFPSEMRFFVNTSTHQKRQSQQLLNTLSSTCQYLYGSNFPSRECLI